MDFDTWGLISSGTAGALIGLWIVRKFARWVPQRFGAKSADALKAEYASAIHAANATYYVAISAAVVSYGALDIECTDWRPLALGLGGGVSSIGLILLGAALARKTEVKEALVAYSIEITAPLSGTITGLGVGLICLVLAIYGYAC